MADIEGPTTPLLGPPTPFTALGLLPPRGFSSIAIPLPRHSLYLSPFDLSNSVDTTSITISEASRAPSTRTSRRLPPPPARPKFNGAYSLLIVNDNPIQRKIVSKICERWGQPYEMAENGQEAVDTYKRDPAKFRCILMDLVMPVLDGFEATKQIRAFEDESWTSFLSNGPTRLPPGSRPRNNAATPTEPVRRAVIIAFVPSYSITGLRSRIVEAGFDLSLSQHPLGPATLATMLFSSPETNVVSLYGGVDDTTLLKAGYPLQVQARRPGGIGEREVGEALGRAVR